MAFCQAGVRCSRASRRLEPGVTLAGAAGGAGGGGAVTGGTWAWDNFASLAAAGRMIDTGSSSFTWGLLSSQISWGESCPDTCLTSPRGSPNSHMCARTIFDTIHWCTRNTSCSTTKIYTNRFTNIIGTKRSNYSISGAHGLLYSGAGLLRIMIFNVSESKINTFYYYRTKPFIN